MSHEFLSNSISSYSLLVLLFYSDTKKNKTKQYLHSTILGNPGVTETKKNNSEQSLKSNFLESKTGLQRQEISSWWELEVPDKSLVIG